MIILRPFRTFLDAIQGLTTAITRLATMAAEWAILQRERAPAHDRLEALERSRDLWEVKIEALVMEAKGSYQAANNAEARTRTMKRHYENLDEHDPGGTEAEGLVRTDHAEQSEEKGLQPLHLDVAPDHKAIALRYKFS